MKKVTLLLLAVIVFSCIGRSQPISTQNLQVEMRINPLGVDVPAWSQTCNWTMALLDAREWKASWIGLDSLTATLFANTQDNKLVVLDDLRCCN